MSFQDLQQYKTADIIKQVYPPILVVIGLAGNFTSISVLFLPRNRKMSTSIFLIALAVCDSLVLVVSLLANWVRDRFDYSVRDASDSICKIHIFLVYSLFQLSSWILVAVTIERVVSVVRPYTVREICTRVRAGIVVCCLVVIIMGLNAHLLYGYHIEYIPRRQRSFCIVRLEHAEFMFKIWPWIDFVVLFAVPFAVLVIGNAVIVVKLRASRQFQHQNSSDHHRRRRHSPLSRMVVTINTAFVICVAPSAIYGIGQPYWFPEEEMTPQSIADITLTTAVTIMLLYVNNSVNFALYVMFGSKFRQDLKGMCCGSSQTPRRGSNVNGSIQQMSSFSGSRTSIASVQSTL